MNWLINSEAIECWSPVQIQEVSVDCVANPQCAGIPKHQPGLTVTSTNCTRPHHGSSETVTVHGFMEDADFKNRRYRPCTNQTVTGAPDEQPTHVRSAVTHVRGCITLAFNRFTRQVRSSGTHHQGRPAFKSDNPVVSSISVANSSGFCMEPSVSANTVHEEASAISGRHGRAPTSTANGIFSWSNRLNSSWRSNVAGCANLYSCTSDRYSHA